MSEIAASFGLNSVREDRPGPKWQALFETHWPYYREWFLSEGHLARPGYVTSAKMLREHMPELVPVYDRLVELAGGGDLAARFLSFCRPPAYVLGCSQAVWTRDGAPFLARNYDYSSRLFEGNLLRTRWLRPVIAVSDCLWGVLDGINRDGLAASLAFGGGRTVGDGFGIPLILRYLLETCESVEAASRALRRIPAHMPYNVMVLDRAGGFATAFLRPGRAADIIPSPVCTNHQQEIEWVEFARTSATLERKEFLETRLADPTETRTGFLRRFLRAPLHSAREGRAFGTLYTAVYRPNGPAVEYRWPRRPTLHQSFSRFEEGVTNVRLSAAHFRARTVS